VDLVMGPGETATATATRAPGSRSASRTDVLVGAGLVLRINTTTGSGGFGGGFAVAATLGRADRPVRPILGLSLAEVRVSNGDGAFTHALAAAQAGLFLGSMRAHATAALEACLYWVSISSATSGTMSGTESALALGLRLGLGYRVGRFEIGAAVRALGGPTFWLEPVSLAAVF
jgi:hypothetical protein